VNAVPPKEVLKEMVKAEIRGIPYSKAVERFGPYFVERRGRALLKDELRKRVRVVLTGGVFDCLHYGHLLTLRKAKELGDLLVVVVARDETVERRKGRKPLQGVKERAEVVSSLSFVDVALEGAEDFQETIERVRPDVVVFGYDQKPFPVPGAEVVQLSVEKKGVKSSLFRLSGEGDGQ